MKRYSLLHAGKAYGRMHMLEIFDGEWVEYEDVKDLEKQNAKNEKIINSMYAGTWYNAPKEGRK